MSRCEKWVIWMVGDHEANKRIIDELREYDEVLEIDYEGAEDY